VLVLENGEWGDSRLFSRLTDFYTLRGEILAGHNQRRRNVALAGSQPVGIKNLISSILL